MTQESKKTNHIETIEGKNPILLIAPHGHPKNDEKTNTITALLAERLDCYAVINEYYHRQRKIRNNKSGKLEERPHNLKIGKANLNYLPHIFNTALKDEFLKPILDFKNKITANQQATLVILHGMKNKSAKADGKAVDIFIGIGQDDPENKSREDRLTATKAEAEKLKIILEAPNEQPINAIIVKGGKYSGRGTNNLNQLFAERNKAYQDDKVQSFQLEIKYTGFRDTKENIENTAERLSIAGYNMK